ncbi:MAG: thioredoxin domain-containing protein [Spirochaetes bacterium]|nr:thioredoxin domain-containing protein [Spirochaetota bacterium]
MTHDKPLPTPEELAALPPDGGAEFNRLVFTRNPYLLQHARNPVDWWEWCECAFLTAERQQKPVFLSIGYSTCHWCHVMAGESFEDGEVAALLNEHFVCIKVDREERPDIDQYYMQACQAMTGSGGWPLSLFLLPDRRPFFAGTYFPKQAMGNRHGMMTLIPAIAEFWKNRREELVTSAQTLHTELQAWFDAASEPPDSGKDLLEAGVYQLAQRYDAERGGFGEAPKFPIPHQYSFLARYGRAQGDAKALGMASDSLLRMARGGIFDQIGFGWHRYSTDAHWLVPHFEKMLYDQALMVLALCDAWVESRAPGLETAVKQTLEYVLRDLRHPEGGFYAAEDADSEGEEGRFYLWTTAEVKRALGEDEGRRACAVWHLEHGGNFTAETGAPNREANIPHRPLGDPEDPDLEALRLKLLELRSQRVRPRLDDKIMADWNGLMIAALSRAGSVFGRADWLEAARAARRFVEGRLLVDGALRKTWRLGTPGGEGLLDDYAFYIHGLLHFHQATLDLGSLDLASRLCDSANVRFWDDARRAYRLSPVGSELPLRPLSFYDGALPSGNSVMAWNLAMLHRLADREEGGLRHALFAAGPSLARAPSNHAFALLALLLVESPAQEVVIAADRAEAASGFLQVLHAHPHPNRSIRLLLPSDARVPAWMEGMKTGSGARAFLCENQRCRAPVASPEELRAALTSP